jgi:site-specific DNA-cytosine methylase
MKILIACEESQAVCKEFRQLGFEAYSCDILDCSGGHPEWHIKDDILKVINDKWDVMISFPPCTHLTVSGAMHFAQKRKDGRQQQGIDFFMAMINAPIKHIAVENPIGIMSKNYRKPDQIIQPYYFGDPFQKTTCLWLKNLPKLYHNKEPNLFDNEITHVENNKDYKTWICKKTGKIKRQQMWYYEALINAKTKEERSTIRSKTFHGIAKAMAIQWGDFLTNKHK